MLRKCSSLEDDIADSHSKLEFCQHLTTSAHNDTHDDINKITQHVEVIVNSAEILEIMNHLNARIF